MCGARRTAQGARYLRGDELEQANAVVERLEKDNLMHKNNGDLARRGNQLLSDELKQANAALRSLRGSAMGQDDGWIIDAVDEALSALETGDD